MRDPIAGIECEQLQLDELWGYMGKKQAHVQPSDPAEFGGAYTFIGLDPISKLVIHHSTGKRDDHATRNFMRELARRVVGHTHISVDGFNP